MADKKGWIALHRSLQNHWLWNDKPFSKGQAWTDLILLANYEDRKIPYKGTVITCKRGDVNLSMLELGKRWGWDRKKVKRFLDVLMNDQMVSLNATTHRTTITLINYDFYQGQGATNGTTNGQQGGQPMTITNNINNFNNGNKDINSDFHPPTEREVQQYINSKGYSVDAGQFINYYKDLGWKYRGKYINWRSKIDDWEKNKRKWAKERENTNEKEVIDNEQREGYTDDCTDYFTICK